MDRFVLGNGTCEEGLPPCSIPDGTTSACALWRFFPSCFSRPEAAPWAKAAGYGWVTSDVLAGVWIVSSSRVSRAWPVTVVGTITGLRLTSYSFVGDVLPESFLAPAGICILIWFALVAIFHQPAEERSAASASPASV
ncbi:hypothetical protein SUDANB15_07712 (plasmid) [Streptomyces sp. enrichment culture]|uniref:hypothetical protein n=1 Tax=Streptomyces sp. enrichment culture TaxID=1795815 RepID=UPI003F55CFA5